MTIKHQHILYPLFTIFTSSISFPFY